MSKKYKYRKKWRDENGIDHDIKANTKKELNEKILKREREIEEGINGIYSKNTTVKAWGENCEEQFKSDLAISTIENRRTRNKKWIYDNIGNMRVKDVKQIHIQNIMNSMQGLSADLINKVYQSLYFIFEKAVENDIIRKNPCKGVVKPRGTKTTRRAITELERKYILQVADTDEQYTYFLFMLFCSCRTGEVANLQGRDIIKRNGFNYLHINGTKTRSSIRDVPIPRYLMKRIPKTEPFEYIFKNRNGGKMSKKNANDLWKRFKRDMNIAMGSKVYRNAIVNDLVASDLEPYCLRHTFGTDCLRRNVPLKVIQELMGHSSITVTANIYTHVTEDILHETAMILQDLGQNVENKVEIYAEAVGNTGNVIPLSRR